MEISTAPPIRIDVGVRVAAACRAVRGAGIRRNRGKRIGFGMQAQRQG
jgi:hypothetical protein